MQLVINIKHINSQYKVSFKTAQSDLKFSIFNYTSGHISETFRHNEKAKHWSWL